MKTVQRAQAILDIEIGELRRVRRHLGKDFSQAVQVLLEGLSRGGKIVVTGVGKSFHIAQKIAATLSSTGSTSVTVHPSQAMHGDIGILGPNDVLLALSHSGESDEILEILPVVKRQGARIVALTGTADSALARASDAVIRLCVRREACPFNMAPTASTTAALAVGDALAIVLLEARGFKKEDFAKLHPGGAIGRTLLLRVADIMRTGERLARVGLNAKIKDAILAMTSARAGAAVVVGPGQKLAGIFTDGDLRRLISRHRGDIAGLPVSKAMTRKPVTVRAQDLAVEVLKLYEGHAIDDLPVVDSQGRLVGMVDIQDLPKFKIM
jgi:arabinose-5-phosphate isomerase